jgi:hypothetical protein
MAEKIEKTLLPEVPKQIFAKFLDELGATDIPVELVGRLRKTILEDQVITEGAVKAALSTTKTP